MQETKQLELLTIRYEELLRKELKLEAVAKTIAEREHDIILREERIDDKLQSLSTQRQQFKEEKLCSAKIEQRLWWIEDRAQMDVEDQLSYLLREQHKCVARMEEAQRYHQKVNRDKVLWSQNMEQQRLKLNTLVDEKLEQVSIIEVNIKERLRELGKAESAVRKEKKELEEWSSTLRKELTEEKEHIQIEKERMNVMYLELEEMANLGFRNLPMQTANRGSKVEESKYRNAPLKAEQEKHVAAAPVEADPL